MVHSNGDGTAVVAGLTFDGGRVRDSGFELRFIATVGSRQIPVSVLVSKSGRVTFPHCLDQSGASLGSDRVDAEVRERSREVLLILEAVDAWTRFSSEGSWIDGR